MKQEVYLAGISESDQTRDVKKKIARLFDTAGLAACFAKKDLVAVKIHFGEKGNEGHIDAGLAKVVSDKVRAVGAKPFFTDTNTLYSGQRANTHDHLMMAAQHGFSLQKLGAPVVIADGLKGQNQVSVPIEGGKHFKVVRIAADFLVVDAMIALTHVTGHIAAGYAGAIKNVGMGCAARAGKLAQHSDILPEILEEKCTGCGTCAEWCPEHAIVVEGGKARVDESLCIACGECLAVCPSGAVKHTWGNKSTVLNERMAEHAWGAINRKTDKCAYVNFIIDFTAECDCMGKKQDPLIPDIGILASRDIVAVDHATIDIINRHAGRDIFRELTPHLDYMSQLTHAASLGLGTLDYELISL